MSPDFTYVLHILGFSLPILLFLYIRKRTLIYKERRALLSIVVFAVLFQSITESIALSWNAWAFSGSGLLQIWPAAFPIEELLLALLFPLTLASVIVVLLDWKRRGKHQWLVG